ncbi:MAG: hypothetical protein IT371_10965 [Deltaproteobacteria bacterium]|nr:hypothetical protein [Deltaproteobacteria bacterium]
MRRERRLAVLSLCAVGTSGWVMGCGGGPSPEQVRERTSMVVGRLLGSAGDALENARGMDALKQLFQGTAVVESHWSGGAPVTTPPGMPPSDPMPVPVDTMGRSKDLRKGSLELAAQIDQTLSQTIFHPGNVESSGGGSTTFLLRGSVVCVNGGGFGSGSVGRAPTPVPLPPMPNGDSSSGSGGNGGGDDMPADSFGGSDDVPMGNGSGSGSSKQSSCVQSVDQLQLRIVATLVEPDGVDLALRVGAGSDPIVVLELRPGSVTVRGDLAAAKAAVQQILAITGAKAPQLPTVMEGVIEASLTFATGSLSAKVSVLEEVRIEGTTPDGAYRFKVAQGTPVASASLEAGKVTAASTFGRLEGSWPARWFWSRARGQVALVVPAARATATATAQKLAITGVSLGEATSTFTLDGKPLVKVDVNPQAGRKLDVTVTPWQKAPRCEASPELDLQVRLNWALLNPYLVSPVKVWAADEQYRLRLQDPGKHPAVVPVMGSTSSDGGLRVAKGTLSLETFVQPGKVTVPEGSCVTFSRTTAPEAHAILGPLTVGACPN